MDCGGSHSGLFINIVLHYGWLGGVVVRALDLRSKGHGFNSRLALSGNDSGQVVHINVPLSPSSITGTLRGLSC